MVGTDSTLHTGTTGELQTPLLSAFYHPHDRLPVSRKVLTRVLPTCLSYIVTSVKRALQSQHFAAESVQLLADFMPYVLAEKLATDVVERLKEVVNSAGKGQSL